MTGMLANETTLRLGAGLSVLTLMALWELAAPRRRREVPRLLRWSNNLALVVMDGILLRLVFPVAATGLALVLTQQGWGILALLALPSWAAVLLALLVLDLAIYLQHKIFHAVPLLWRLHRMHHSDTEIDVSTGLRFHPAEILASMVIKLAVIALLGPPAVAVLLFEVILNATSLFNHANIRLAPRLDAALRWIVVTPDMHRVHHSVRREETDSNFGFNLPWWDHLFGTYRAQPQDGHTAMQIGLPEFRSRADQRLDRLLLQPLRNPTDRR